MELAKQQPNSKRRLKLNDIAEILQIKKFAIRSWEKELNLAPMSGFYGAEALDLFKKIKHLVQVERHSLEGVRSILDKEHFVAHVELVAAAANADLLNEGIDVQSKDCALSESQESSVEQVPQGENLSDYGQQARTEDVEVSFVAHEESYQNPLEPVGRSYAGATEVESFPQEKVKQDEAQQKFLSELAFFKQELLKFQRLINV